MEKCILCGLKSVSNRQEGASRTIYNCNQCGVFVVSDLVEKDVKNKADEIRSYLMTRKLANKDSDTVLISYEKSNLDKDYLRITVDEILETYPKTFAGRMEMALQNIGYMSDFPGYEIRIFDIQSAPLFFVKGENVAELLYLVEALRGEGLVELKYYGGQSLPFGVTVSPKGWKRLEASEKSKAVSEKLFVHFADSDEKITAQLRGALEKAAKACGYQLEESTASQVTFDLVVGVKMSELTICDLTGQTGSAYYAAAMAQGFGRFCILTCHASAAKKLQLDTNQFRVIIWDKQDALYTEIVSTIRAMI